MTQAAIEVDPDELAQAHFLTWWESMASIRGRSDDDTIRMITAPELMANELQCKIDEAIEWCEVNGEPCRIIVLKPRKEGSSTILVGKSYHLLRSTEAQFLVIGDQASTTQTMWSMLKTYYETDGMQWPNKVQSFTDSAKAGAHMKLSHGASAWSETAGDKRAGQSTTPTVILAEEVAHWGRDGAAANASDTMLALLNAIPDVPDTYVFISSTANGVGNFYHRTYEGSVTLEERKQGKKGNGWIRVFQPWHRSKWATARITPEERVIINSTLSESEKRGVQLYGWTAEQMAWRRNQIAAKCDGDEGKFNQENPPSEVEAFLTSGRPVFNADGMTRLEKMAANAKPNLKHGNLVRNNMGIIWQPDPDGWLTVFEPPEYGKAYVSSLDTCTHEQAEGAKDPDEHSFWMLRKCYRDHKGAMVNTRATARIRKPCRWDATLLAEKIELVIRWYGNPMIVPETNKGLDVINELKRLGVSIYMRQKFDRINPGQTLNVIGWETNEQSRPIMVKAIVDAVREQTFDLECEDAIGQMRTFVRNARGKACAASGRHDDDPMSLSIGLACIESATVYSPPDPMTFQQTYGYQENGIAHPSGAVN